MNPLIQPAIEKIQNYVATYFGGSYRACFDKYAVPVPGTDVTGLDQNGIASLMNDAGVTIPIFGTMWAASCVLSAIDTDGDGYVEWSGVQSAMSEYGVG